MRYPSHPVLFLVFLLSASTLITSPSVFAQTTQPAEYAIKAALGDWKKKQGEADVKPAEAATAHN